MMYKLWYFKKTKGDICGSDFENSLRCDYVNLGHIVSVSWVEMFRLPLSGDKKGMYSMVTMVNGDKYFIHDVSFRELVLVLNGNKGVEN